MSTLRLTTKKQDVQSISDLYEIFADGGEYGWYAYVVSETKYAAWTDEAWKLLSTEEYEQGIANGQVVTPETPTIPVTPVVIDETLASIPVLKYLKDPVDKLTDLYMRYPEGGEYGWYAFVFLKKTFAWWNESTEKWELIGSESGNGNTNTVQAITLKSITTEPTTAPETGDIYYNSTDKLLYEAEYVGGQNVWNKTYTALAGVFYLFETSAYLWDGTNLVDPTKSGSKFTSDFIANPAFGRYAAGQNVPATGKDFQELILDAFNDYLKPILSNMNTTGLPTLVECGTTVGGNVGFTFSISNGSNLQANSLSVQDISAGIALVENKPVVSPVIATTGNIKRTINGGYNTWQLRAMSSRGDAIMSNQFTTVWRLKTFHGAVDSTPTTSAQIRALAAEWDTVKTISININKPKYVIALRSGITIKKVITESFENITNDFKEVAQINVVLADGTTIATYTIMQYTRPDALGAPATITLN